MTFKIISIFLNFVSTEQCNAMWSRIMWLDDPQFRWKCVFLVNWAFIWLHVSYHNKWSTWVCNNRCTRISTFMYILKNKASEYIRLHNLVHSNLHFKQSRFYSNEFFFRCMNIINADWWHTGLCVIYWCDFNVISILISIRY